MTIRNYRAWVVARLDENGLNVELRGSAAYTDDGRAVTVSVPPASDAELKPVAEALLALLEANQAALERATTLAAANALSVAARMGELK